MVTVINLTAVAARTVFCRILTVFCIRGCLWKDSYFVGTNGGADGRAVREAVVAAVVVIILVAGKF